MSPSPVGDPRIALAIDNAYVPWAATVLRSAVQANPGEHLRFDVVHDGSVAQETQTLLHTMLEAHDAEVVFHTFADEVLHALPRTEVFGPIVWLRLYLPEILEHADRVLYLDSDTFVVDSLRPLWDTPLESATIGAVANIVEPGARRHVQKLGLTYPGGFFNSGVLLFDLARMRADESTQQLVQFARDNRDLLLWPDQDALNAVFADRWLPLHPRWNVQSSYWVWRDWALEVFGSRLLEEAVTRPAIRHFEGPNLSKPWNFMCPHPWRKEYRETLRRTPWGNLPLEDKTITTRLIRLLPRTYWTPVYKRLLYRRAAMASSASGQGPDPQQP